MAEQLRHLIEVGRLPHVAIRVVPLAAGLQLGTLAGPFVLLDFPPQRMRMKPEPPVVYREWLTGEPYLDRPAEIAAYEAPGGNTEGRTCPCRAFTWRQRSGVAVRRRS